MNDYGITPHDDPAVRAFRALRDEGDTHHAEVMARLAEAPDYAPSFALTNKKLDWLVECHSKVRTDEDLIRWIAEAAVSLREPDCEAQGEAIAALNASRKAFDRAREAHEWSNRIDRSVAEQKKQCRRWGIGGLIAGPLGTTMLVYLVLHVMPASWLLAERLAARTLGMGMTDAGIRLLVAGNPAMADAIGNGLSVVMDNRGNAGCMPSEGGKSTAASEVYGTSCGAIGDALAFYRATALHDLPHIHSAANASRQKGGPRRSVPSSSVAHPTGNLQHH